MKKKFIVLGLMLVVSSATWAVVVLDFPGWGRLTQSSQDIIIVHCNRTTDLKETMRTIRGDGLIDSMAEIVAVLKGTTNTGSVQINSQYWLHQNENYLIFACYHDGFYDASEAYRVIPLGPYFSTNSLSGKTLDGQIQMLLQRRLNNLNREMKEAQEEKQRLEEFFKK